MTPMQLRQRAAQFVESSRGNLNARRFESASLDAGFAAELVLKAAYCIKLRWPTWPADKKGFVAQGGDAKAFSHGLTDLLRLSDSAQIPKFTSINWDAIASWNVKERYSPCGSADPALVSKRVDETAKLCLGLSQHQLIRTLRDFHIAEATNYGWFNLFTLEERPGRPELDLRVAARWIAEAAHVREFYERARAFRAHTLPEDLALLWARTNVLDSNDEHTRHMNALCGVRGPETIIYLQNVRSSGGHIADQYILASGDERLPPIPGNAV